MRKKITFLILLTLLFISFVKVKAQEQKPDLIISNINFVYNDDGIHDGYLSIMICNLGSPITLDCDNNRRILEVDHRYGLSSISECGNIEMQSGDCREYKYYETAATTATYSYNITVDPGNVFDEANEDNNTISKTININQSKNVDLIPVSLEISNPSRKEGEAYQYGDIVDISIALKNDSNYDIDNEFYYIVADEGFTRSNPLRSNLLGLGSQEIYKYTARIMWPYNATDDIKLTLRVDDKNNVLEKNEDNNIFEKTITVSNGNVNISNITALSPNGGENWEVGETHRISWVSTGIQNITMYLYDNRISGSGAIVNYPVPNNQPISASQGYYDWVILPNVLQANDGKNFQIIIQDANNYQLSDKSDAPFSIVAAGSSVSEQVKCVFKGSQTEQKCYTADDNNVGCSGENACVVDVTGIKGNKITWKSSCGGYVYTTMDGLGEYDGHGEYAEFDCTPAIVDINNNAKDIFNNKYENILFELKQLRNIVKEQQNEIKYLKSMASDLKNISDQMKRAINDFITYGVDANTVKLGAGERAAVINSYKSAFNKLPETEAELTDVIKIANGRWPSITNNTAEKKAKEQFQKIYKRIADMNNASDNAAVTVMAYGLRQKAENRNLSSEKAGINIFKSIYGYTPKTTEDWNIMQAVTYSGASRGVDTDGDLLTDDREAELGTDPNKKDTDGDGFMDGVEVANGYNPKGEGKL